MLNSSMLLNSDTYKVHKLKVEFWYDDEYFLKFFFLVNILIMILFPGNIIIYYVGF